MNASQIQELQRFRIGLGLFDSIETIYSKEQLEKMNFEREKSRTKRGARLAKECYDIALKAGII